MKEAERKLYEKGYYLSNQFDGFGTVSNEYELADKDGNTVIDHLSEAQVIALVEMLQEEKNNEKNDFNNLICGRAQQLGYSLIHDSHS